MIFSSSSVYPKSCVRWIIPYPQEKEKKNLVKKTKQKNKQKKTATKNKKKNKQTNKQTMKNKQKQQQQQQQQHTHTHIFIITLSSLIIFTNPSSPAGYGTRSIFKRSLTDLNSKFSFSFASFLTKAEEPSLSYYLPIAGGWINFLNLLRSLFLS